MTRLIFLICTYGALSSMALAGVGEPTVNISMADPGPDPLCLMVVPDGSGPDLTEARTLTGGSADATITVEILSLDDSPIAGFPAEDIWLESEGGGLTACSRGSTADAPTDALGRTTFSRPLRAGGWSLAMTHVLVNGSSNTNPTGLNLVVNSPDINGDLEVNLSDVQLFALDFYAPTYSFRSDLAFDSQVNLSDIVPLSMARGAVCP